MLTPLALIGKIAALLPPPRMHRHRYYGVLAPHAPLRAAVTALAPVPVPPPPPADPAGAPQASAQRAAARYLWAMLLARTPRVLPAGRIDEVLPLTCPFCHASMRLIAFINDASAVRQILDHLGEATRPPRIAPARRPPLGEAATAAAASNAPAWDHTPPAGTGGRIRSAPHLVRSNSGNSAFALGTLGCSMHRAEDSESGLDHHPAVALRRTAKCGVACGLDGEN